FPPTCNSSKGTNVEYSSEGENHRASSTGSVQARKTLSRGAWKVRLTLSVVSGDRCSLAIADPPSAIEPGNDRERQTAIPRIAGIGKSMPLLSSKAGQRGGNGACGRISSA